MPEPDEGWASAAAAFGADRATWPAFMSQLEARTLAERRRMRLLRAREWVHVAVGPRAHRFPWGPNFQSSIANTLELGLERPAPVGTFENGRSLPFGCYDMLGNAWEWVSDRVPGYEDAPEDLGTPAPGRVSALGGSFLTAWRPIYGPGSRVDRADPVFFAVTLDPAHKAPDLGLRCAIEARAWLPAAARGWSGGAAARERLLAVGRRWGRAALPLLEELARETGLAGLEVLAEGARTARP
jgi:formylglycine-generating enzyme required for sulfatase activity